MIQLRSLAALNSADVAANLADTVQRVQEDNPTLDVRRGVFANLLAYYHAVLATQRQAEIADYLQGRSLQAILADPAAVDDDLVDDVLANYKLTRKAGAAATGSATVIVASDVTTTIAQGSVWIANGQAFTTPTVFTAKKEEDQINSTTDRLLTATLNGKWAFTIDLVASAVGEAGNIAKDVAIVPAITPANFVKAFAASSFEGGTDTETNEELMARQQVGIAAQMMGNRTSMEAMLTAIAAFASVVNMSIVGFGDAEMLRDQHTIFPVANGGRADWYIRTQEQLAKLALTKTATLLSKVGAVGTWQISLARNDAPGLYEVANIRLEGADNTTLGFPIVSDTRALDLTGDGFIPDIVDVVEGVYSRFQTAVIHFQDTTTNASGLTIGATASYTLEARCLPLIGDIQDTVSGRNVRNYGADCLVKAPVPCFTTMSFTINKKSTDADPVVATIKTAVCTLVNTIGYVGQLSASQVQDAVHAYLSAWQTVSALSLAGRVRYPDGTDHTLSSGSLLQIPDAPDSMVSARTAQFFIAPENITITITASIPSDT